MTTPSLYARVLRLLAQDAARHTVEPNRFMERDARQLVAGLNLLNGHIDTAITEWLDNRDEAARAERTAPVRACRYVVATNEAGENFPHCSTDVLDYAKARAIACWDDAMPRNDIHVYDMRTVTLVGSAVHAGDGSAEWRDAQ